MSSNKAALKAARAALDVKDYDRAITQCQLVLASDAQSYQARVFLGLAFDKQGKADEAAKAYEAATKIKSNDLLAWQGLLRLYEGQASKRVDEYRVTAVRIAEIYAEANDRDNCQIVTDKMISFCKQHGSTLQYRRALEALLPGSSIYNFLEGRIPHPSHTYTRLAEIVEAEETQRVNKEIGERRTRLGARLGQVTAEVKREVYSDSPLESLYQSVIAWTNDDIVRRSYEQKLLQRMYDTLTVLLPNQKEEKRQQVVEYANGTVIIKHPFKLAWDIKLEWTDAETVQIFDVGVLREYIAFFQESGLSQVLQGYLSSDLSPFPQPPPSEDKDDAEKEPPLKSEERIIMMTNGLELSKDSALSHRLMAEYYLHLDEHESAVETARVAIDLIHVESEKSGLRFQANIDALNSTLATALVQYQSPRHHPEAKALFEEMLQRKPDLTAALIGAGYIFEEREEHDKAIDFLERALIRDPENLRVRVEAAWCKALKGDHQQALEELQPCLPRLQGSDARSRDLRAQVHHRIGICVWELNTSKTARKDRGGAYAHFLASIKANVNYAPPYTNLGIYYADYAKDRKRARQCFQKAFELSSVEVLAAERLARVFADQGEWDLVELVAQRVVESGKCRPAPGSKRKGISWPFAALGIVQMNKQEYSKAIVSFQHALRISPDDYHSWVGLGESYHNSGRYNAASRTFRHAEELDCNRSAKEGSNDWFAKYMLANVDRELGDYDSAIARFEDVLRIKPSEFGVQIALLQTLVEQAWHYVGTGFFGRAADRAKEAIENGIKIAEDSPHAFNLWKALGDACTLYSDVQSRAGDTPVNELLRCLQANIDINQYDLLAEIDGIGHGIVSEDAFSGITDSTQRCLYLALLSYKRAIFSCAHDFHAQAVAYYNLGWASYRTHTCLKPILKPSTPKQANRFLKSSMRCFKRAIELEAGNAEFWNALGIVTTEASPPVAQHSFVRSLHLNDRDAKVWTNLGTLYLLQNDFELAHMAFARAQSSDPDYAHAWIGEGFVASMLGDHKEARNHFAHAIEISDSSSVLVKRQYALSTFDILVSSTSTSENESKLLQPLLALQQLQQQRPTDTPYQHIAALFLERTGDYTGAVEALTSVCASAEQAYEISESPQALANFVTAKGDLARNELATGAYRSASENAQTALLLADDEFGTLTADARRKLRLSTHLTDGIANYFRKNFDQSVAALRSALKETSSSPDVTCLLSQVLWATAGEKEKAVARDQLFDCVERSPGHIGAVCLLGVIAVLDDDEEMMATIKDELTGFRTDPVVKARDKSKIEEILATIVAAQNGFDGDSIEALAHVVSSVALFPGKPRGWRALAESSGEVYPAQMAVKAALQAAPPQGNSDAVGLAEAFSVTGAAGDAQRSICLAPWIPAGWEQLSNATKESA